MLKDAFEKALQDISGITTNVFLDPMIDVVTKVDIAASSNKTLRWYAKKLCRFLAENGFGTNGRSTNEFVQTLGEAHFYLLCQERGAALVRIPESGRKTPDFRAGSGSESIFFEVKTLSVVDGERGIDKALTEMLEAKIDIDAQLERGRRVGMATAVVQPFGAKPCAIRGAVVTGVIDTLLEKTRQNIKGEQFASPNTFLVVNLSLLSGPIIENVALRPAYCEGSLRNTVVTGELWMMAFGQTGMLIHGAPEWEGLPGIEGVFNKAGILVDPEYSRIAGIVFMVHSWHRECQLWGLFRAGTTFHPDGPSMVTAVMRALVGDNWNDNADSNGWQLRASDGRG